MRRFAAAVLLLLLCRTGFCFCFSEAAAYYGLDPLLLRAIARVESNYNPRAFRRNPDGTVDVGLMQINSFWFPHVVRAGFSPGDLWNPCINVYFGAWILARCMYRTGNSVARALDCYHRGAARATGYSPYVRKVLRVYRSLRSKRTWVEAFR